MEDLSKKTVMFVDNGLFCAMASRIAKDFGKVYYHCGQGGPFPHLSRARIGYGMPGLELVESPFDVPLDEIDLWVFPDIGWGALQQHLVAFGCRVWGARRGDELENERVAMKKLMKKLGLPVGPYHIVKGGDALLEFMKTHDNVYSKLPKYRGDWETIGGKSFEELEPKLKEDLNRMGALRHTVEFVVEEAIPDAVELGTDYYNVDGQFPSQLLAGVEVKDRGYLAKFCKRSELPEPLIRVDDALSPTLKGYQYRGFCSTEVRIGKDHKPYLVDYTARAGSPPNELYQEFYLNLSQILWEGAGGVLVDPEPIAKFGAQITIHSTYTTEHEQPVLFDKSVDDRVKLVNCAIIDDIHYVLCQHEGMEVVGSVIGWGDTPESAIEDAKTIAKEVHGYAIDVPQEALDEAQSQIDKAAEFGLKMF